MEGRNTTTIPTIASIETSTKNSFDNFVSHKKPLSMFEAKILAINEGLSKLKKSQLETQALIERAPDNEKQEANNLLKKINDEIDRVEKIRGDTFTVELAKRQLAWVLYNGSINKPIFFIKENHSLEDMYESFSNASLEEIKNQVPEFKKKIQARLYGLSHEESSIKTAFDNFKKKNTSAPLFNLTVEPKKMACDWLISTEIIKIAEEPYRSHLQDLRRNLNSLQTTSPITKSDTEKSFFQRHPIFKKVLIGAAIGFSAALLLGGICAAIVFGGPALAGVIPVLVPALIPAAGAIGGFVSTVAAAVGIPGAIGIGLAAAGGITALGAAIGGIVGVAQDSYEMREMSPQQPVAVKRAETTPLLIKRSLDALPEDHALAQDNISAEKKTATRTSSPPSPRQFSSRPATSSISSSTGVEPPKSPTPKKK